MYNPSLNRSAVIMRFHCSVSGPRPVSFALWFKRKWLKHMSPFMEILGRMRISKSPRNGQRASSGIWKHGLEMKHGTMTTAKSVGGNSTRAMKLNMASAIEARKTIGSVRNVMNNSSSRHHNTSLKGTLRFAARPLAQR
jgi:hypothetical protein